MILTKIKQHPVVSAIIAIAIFTAIGCLIVFATQTVSLMAMMLFAWILLMGGSAIVFVFAAIMLLLKAEQSEEWKRLLLNTLWILLVGGGSCGLLGFLMDNWFF